MRGRLSGFQSLRLVNLFDMMYTPAELSGEIGFSTRQFYRVYLPAGCPCVRSSGRVWVNGQAFAAWYKKFYSKKRGVL